jgi:hypothetical protein
MHQEVLNVSQWPLLKTPFHYLHQKVKVGLKGWLRSYGLIRGYHLGMKRSTRIKDYHLKGCMVGQKCKPKISGSNNDSLFSTNSSIITPQGDTLIFYFTESIFFHGDVIRDIGEKRLHVLDASVDVTLHPFHLFLTH